MQCKKEIHTEKRKNEFLSSRILEMEKSLSAMADEFDAGHDNGKGQGSDKNEKGA
jgi:hypothetical protein